MFCEELIGHKLKRDREKERERERERERGREKERKGYRESVRSIGVYYQNDNKHSWLTM